MTEEIFEWPEDTSGGIKPSSPITGEVVLDTTSLATIKLTNLTNGKIPYHVSDAAGLADGPVKTDVDSAVSLKHTQQHAITSTSDHTSTATAGQMLKADANGLPVNATNTDAQVSSAVTASHAAVTISGTSPLSLSGQAISLKNDAAAAITEVDTGTLANSDTVVPTSKAVTTKCGLYLPLAGGTMSGNLLNTEMPAFQARPSSTQTNLAIDQFVTISFGTEVFDQGGNFASNTFTAPVTGKYQLSAGIYLLNVDSACTYFTIDINTSNRYYTFTFDPSKFSGDIGYWGCIVSALADMDAGDTANVRYYQAGGTEQTDVYITSWFSGCLVC